MAGSVVGRRRRWAPSCSASRWPSPATTCPPASDRPGTLPLSAASALAVLPGDLIQLDLGPSWPGLYVSPAAGGAGGVTVPAGAEVPVSLSAAAGLSPGPVPVVSATLLRFDVVVQLVPPGGGAGQQLELWPSLSFNPPDAGPSGSM